MEDIIERGRSAGKRRLRNMSIQREVMGSRQECMVGVMDSTLAIVRAYTGLVMELPRCSQPVNGTSGMD